MSAKDLFYSEDKEFSNAEDRLYAREELVYNVTEDVLLVLEDLGISKKELAERLGKSRSFVTQILSGARNMTLGSLSDICFSLGVTPKIDLQTDVKNIELTPTHSIKWEEEVVHEKADLIIKKSENIIDGRDTPEWETHTAQAA